MRWLSSAATAEAVALLRLFQRALTTTRRLRPIIQNERGVPKEREVRLIDW
jgi:hypothetical protein